MFALSSVLAHDDAFSSTDETDSLTDLSDDVEVQDYDAPWAMDTGDSAPAVSGSDDFLPCHFWALNAMRRLESGGALYCFPRRQDHIPSEKEADTGGVLLTILNRWSADGANVTFRMNEPFPKPEPALIHVQSTKDTPPATAMTTNAPGSTTEPANAWAVPRVDAHAVAQATVDRSEESASTTSTTTTGSDHNDYNDCNDHNRHDNAPSDDDEDHLSVLVKQYQRRHGLEVDADAQPPVPPSTGASDRGRTPSPAVWERNKPKLCSQGQACSYALENRCDKAHDLREWDPCCKHDKKCRRKHRCPYWHQDVEPITRYLWRMCHVVQDNFFYQRQEFVDAYLAGAPPPPSPTQHRLSGGGTGGGGNNNNTHQRAGGEGARRGRPHGRKQPASTKNAGRK